MSNTFYVYALFDVSGIVRYIGKGKKYRWMEHQQGTQPLRPFVIEAMALFGDVPKVKIHEDLDEFTAYSFEHALIEAIGIHPNGPLCNKTSKGSGPNSRQVKDWHASHTAEQRLSHIRPAVEASMKSEHRQELNKELIKFALAALTEEHHLAAAERLNAGYTGEKRSAAMKLRYENMTAEEKAAFSKKLSDAVTPEQRSSIGRKRNERMTFETRSEIGRKRSAHLTPEQRIENASRIINSQTSEQLSINGKKAQLFLTPEIRSAGATKRAKTLGPDRLREIAIKGVEVRRRKQAERLQHEPT